MVLLLNYRKLDQTDPDLTTQLDVFDQYQNNDEEELGHQGLDLNSPLDVFYAVHKQVSARISIYILVNMYMILIRCVILIPGCRVYI